VPTAGHPRTRPKQVRADKGHPSMASRAWLRASDIKTTIPERDDRIAHHRLSRTVTYPTGIPTRARSSARRRAASVTPAASTWSTLMVGAINSSR
jgi:hypothetical protein